MRDVTTRPDLDAILAAPMAVLLKHGSRCPISASARDELAALAGAHPDLLVAGVEVTSQRELSDHVADRLGVAHQSPQAFVLRDGAVTWQATHFAITARAVEAQLG